MDKAELVKEISKLKQEKNAVILAHNYQTKQVQEIADYLGDSLDLSRRAKELDADILVFAGVQFMAETAKILSPFKKVLIPDKEATCEMADMATVKDILALKKKYPDASVVCYVNTYADVKAICDVCCTSRNAVSVVRGIKNKQIIFVPDKNLGAYVQANVPEKDIILYPGFCYVHNDIKKEQVIEAKKRHPEALFVAHPECSREVLSLADKVASTNGMVKFVRESRAKEFIIGTEVDMVTRLIRENPDKTFYPIANKSICRGMKTISLTDIYNSLLKEQYEIIIPEDIRIKAEKALNEMIKYG